MSRARSSRRAKTTLPSRRGGAARPRPRAVRRRPTRTRARHPARRARGPTGNEVSYFGLGCFWGAEEIFWQIPGSSRPRSATRAAPPRTRRTRRSARGRTGHTEAVRVVYDPAKVSYAELLLKVFWEIHDPTQGMRQGNDVGTQYRSAIYWTTPEPSRPRASLRGTATRTSSHRPPATARSPPRSGPPPRPPYYYAEDYHQQYLHKNPTATAATARTA